MTIEVAINHPETSGITFSVGKLVLNFGAIEHETYVWLACLIGSIDGLADSGLFKTRVDRLLGQLLQVEHARKADAVKAWNNALEVAKFRNRIAHNAVFFGWNSHEQKGAPDFLAVLDAKAGFKDGGDESKITLVEINKRVNETSALALKLREIRGVIWSE